jgi:hypothetical protein
MALSYICSLSENFEVHGITYWEVLANYNVWGERVHKILTEIKFCANGK